MPDDAWCDGFPSFARRCGARARCSRKVISVIRKPYKHVRPRAMAVNRQRARRYRSADRIPSVRAIKPGRRSETRAVIHVGREREQREILAVHVVFEIKDARKSGPGNFGFVPRPVRLLRAQKETQTTLDARATKIAACTNSHDRPRLLRRRAFTDSFHRRIFISRASFAPAAIVILTTLKP